LCVPQGLKGGEERLKGGVEFEEYVEGPGELGVEGEGLGAVVGVSGVVCVEFEVVLQEELEDDVDREDAVV